MTLLTRVFNFHSVLCLSPQTAGTFFIHPMLRFFPKLFFLNNKMSDKGETKVTVCFHYSILLPLKNKNKPPSHNFAVKPPKSLQEKTMLSLCRKNVNCITSPKNVAGVLTLQISPDKIKLLSSVYGWLNFFLELTSGKCARFRPLH